MSKLIPTYIEQSVRVEQLERELVAEKEWVRQSTNSNARLEKFLAEAQAEVVRLKGEAESWEKVFDKTCEHLADAKSQLAEAVAKERERCARVCEEQTKGKSMWIEGARACAAAIRGGE
jgi:septal ring factor EnvC (AmiA/AmiB activator)